MQDNAMISAIRAHLAGGAVIDDDPVIARGLVEKERGRRALLESDPHLAWAFIKIERVFAGEPLTSSPP